MTPLWPALLAAAGVAVALGLPLRPRIGVVPSPRRAAQIPAVALPLLAGTVALITAGVVACLLAAASAVLVRRTLDGRRRAALTRRERAASAEAMAALSAELRAGRVPADAFTAAAEVAIGATATALGAAAAAVQWGAGPEDSLRRHAASTAVPEQLLSLAACWEVCSGTGSSLATGVDRLEEALRQAARQRDLVEAEVAQARASATAMACLPAAGLLLGLGLGGNPLRVLLHTPPGIACLAVGLCLDVLGLWWMRRLVARAVGTPT